MNRDRSWLQFGYFIIYIDIAYCITMLWFGLPAFVLIGVGAGMAVLGCIGTIEKGLEEQ
jgi:hypothetical protein